MPSLHNAYEKVKESGLQILLIDIRESHSAVQRVVKKRGYTLQVLLDRDGAVTK
ncbi:MAG: redoxin domain-containing protein, partial [Deltaproteobacteria bacterium]|nr:redoxin domain-containing protein [Deltaproteobacteria bacterium]